MGTPITDKPTSIVFLGDSLCSGYGVGTDKSFATIFAKEWDDNVPYKNACVVMANATTFLANRGDESKPAGIRYDGLRPENLQSGGNPAFFFELGGNVAMEMGSIYEVAERAFTLNELVHGRNPFRQGMHFLVNNNALFSGADPERVSHPFLTALGYDDAKAQTMSEDEFWQFWRENKENASSCIIESRCEGEYKPLCDFIEERTFLRGYDALQAMQSGSLLKQDYLKK